MLGFRSWRVHWIVQAVVLVGYWALFALYPLSAPGCDYLKAGVPSDWPHRMTGFAAHWNKNSNAASAFDLWFLNLFPRETPYAFNEAGYVTLSFIPTFGTMLLGLITGGVIRSPSAPRAKVKWLLAAGIIGIVAAEVLGKLGLCPVVKRIWTPSWTLFSGGWCFLLTAAFYTLIDIWGWKRWAFPLVVVGMNSITAYCIDILLRGFIYDNLAIHLGAKVFEVFGAAYEPVVHGGAVVLASWLVLWWMYRRKIFLRI